MKMLRHSHTGMRRASAGNRKSSGLWAGRSWGLEQERIWGNMRRNTSSEKLDKRTGRPGVFRPKS